MLNDEIFFQIIRIYELKTKQNKTYLLVKSSDVVEMLDDEDDVDDDDDDDQTMKPDVAA